MLAHLELRRDKLAELRRLAGLEADADLARQMRTNQSSVSRVLSGHSKPGADFVASLIQVFGGPQWFEQLFTIVLNPQGKRR